ncbi:organelle RRM domain-containing protein 2, mitochondrial isoform X1 [Eutrema salsugineum]|uniref:organelle RRM domain-containing protein 2, mitochondrial isoform X1 n=1 Tax=Eutrema salsugineum TaxID=72664 RepID=UPI000CED5452|nr:organelle RRM domain-containing protein 2, mitochondrial isoform X1 [Eutrema salsugineum]
MAFVSTFRRVIAGSNSLLSSPSSWARHCSTLTTPKLFVSGLSRLTTNEKLQDAFAPFGELLDGNATLSFVFITSWIPYQTHTLYQISQTCYFGVVAARVITDRETGRSKGFAFVTYATIDDAEKAKEGMNAKFLDGWVIFVDPARPREPRRPPQQEHHQASAGSGFTTNKTIGWCK